VDPHSHLIPKGTPDVQIAGQSDLHPQGAGDGAGGGGHDEQTLTVRYRVMETEAVDRLASLKTDDLTDFLKEAVVEINDVVGCEDQLLPWNHALRDRLFGLYYERMALVNGSTKGRKTSWNCRN